VKPHESPAESEPEPASPFPPAFRWEASPSEASTQVMSAVGQDTAPDEPGQDAPAVRTRDGSDFDHPQVPSKPSYQQRPGGIGDLFQPTAKPAGTPLNDPPHNSNDCSAPPWADSELPPIADQQDTWLRQGPEVFQTPGMQFRSKQIIGITVLAVVVLGLVGATVAYFLTSGPGRTGTEQIAAAQPTAAARDLPAPPPPLPAPVDTAHALIDPPGQSRGGGGLFDLPQLLAENPKPLRPSIVNALQTGRMIDGVLKTTTSGGTTIGLFALTMPDQETATAVAQTIASEQVSGGLKADDNRALQGMTVVGSVPGSQPTAYRAVYVLYNRAIYVEVFGPNRDAVLTTFDAVIKQQVAYAPPTLRASH
jgi:hypothetical protein